jgi:type I restriction enzyme S subunit
VTSRWPVVPLGEICEILDSKRKPITKSDRIAGTVPYYGASSIQDYVRDFIFDEPLVLLGEDGAKWNAGDRSAFMISGKSWVNNHAHVLRPRREIICNEWLTYFLVGADLNDFISGVTVPKLNQGRMREIPIPLPPLDEQKRLVAKLGEAMELISQSELVLDQNLNKLNELEIAEFTSEFLSLRSVFESTHIADVFKTSSGSTPLKSRRDFYDNGQIPWLLSGEVAQRDITEAKNFITEKALAETAVKLVPPNSVLVAMYGATAGEVGLLGFECTTNQAVCAIHPHPDYLPRFVYYSLLSMQSFLVSQAAGNAQPNVSQAKIKELPFPKVPLRRQEEAVQRLDNVVNMRKELDELQQSKKSALIDLKNSLLSAAFAGEL